MEISRVLNYIDEAPKWVGMGGSTDEIRQLPRQQPEPQPSPERQSQSSEEPSPLPFALPFPRSTITTPTPTSTSTTTTTTTTPNPPSHTIIRNKKPIPRQAGRGYAPKSRAALACNSCRQGKFKCTGEKNQCQRCAMLGKQCWYPAHKRERIQREMDQLVTEANEYRLMLELLLSRVNKEDAEDISALLFKYEK
ncbi:Zn(II)2Cys6 transcription factor domain-containing protein [Aspergillus fijiensis CBS 313.89]|uniref:Zn(2)-C6 fungal-type domain-containing protein n=1 Tax=Aspergillus fijiensis CBS 313.89 TaxID=1448319 RepID=A0A8G1RXB9_9EURO|nr:uncharacterized protein BO72DRAFT_445816 [Aspergillus fijiensis CBS 313.89]RAK80018.1 hypothetical protein BO72DRAFT_445816 [Aspergillus fijiensis CBS 313.89]